MNFINPQRGEFGCYRQQGVEMAIAKATEIQNANKKLTYLCTCYTKDYKKNMLPMENTENLHKDFEKKCTWKIENCTWLVWMN